MYALINCYNLDEQFLISLFLQVFAMELIPKLLRFSFHGVNQVDEYLPTTFPLLVGWTKLIHKRPKTTYKKPTTKDYLQILGELEEDDVSGFFLRFDYIFTGWYSFSSNSLHACPYQRYSFCFLYISFGLVVDCMAAIQKAAW